MVKSRHTEYPRPAMHIPILYEDAWLLVVHKPAGLHVHPTALSPGEASVLQILVEARGGPLFPAHRLDRPTSGVLVFAKDPNTAGRLGEALRGKAVAKAYLALVRGWFPGFVEAESPMDEEDNPQPKPARTLLFALAHHEWPHALGRHPTVRTSLVLALPQTGRRHQIRRHLARSTHPIIGDTGYGDRHHNHFFIDRYACPHLQLFAAAIGFHHPHTGQWLQVQAGPEGESGRILQLAATLAVKKLAEFEGTITPDVAERWRSTC